MSSLPDRTRPRLTRPGRSWTRAAAHLATRVTWRALHPAVRGRFLEAPPPSPLTRLHYEATDGWQAPVFFLPPCPGGAGEPVLLAHGLGVVGDAFRYGQGPTLAERLSQAGFAVYLLSHRGDRDARPPQAGARASACFDDLVERDLPAAAELVVAHAGASRLHYVGFGLGGQLGMVWASRRPETLATLVAAGAPVCFDRPRSHLRWAARATGMLPAHWHLPLRSAARAAVPFLDGPLDPVGKASPGGRFRGVLELASDDLPVGLLQQLGAWLDAGRMVSRGAVLDLVEALSDARVPLLAVAGRDDPLGAPHHVRPAVETWGAGDASLLEVDGLGHLDLFLGEEADRLVFEPVLAWLDARRRLAWDDEEPVDVRVAG